MYSDGSYSCAECEGDKCNTVEIEAAALDPPPATTSSAQVIGVGFLAALAAVSAM